MTYSAFEMGILELLESDARLDAGQAAVMLGAGEDSVRAAMARLEADKVIVGYRTLVNWEKTHREMVKAVIEVRVTPQRDMGFDAIAARVYRFGEVKSVYLMSGAYDLLVEVEATTLRQLANFVSQKLSTIEHVLSTATHFVLKKYKVEGLILDETPGDERLVITP